MAIFNRYFVITRGYLHQKARCFDSKVWADVTNDLLSQNNGAGADLLGITGYMSPQGDWAVGRCWQSWNRWT